MAHKLSDCSSLLHWQARSVNQLSAAEFLRLATLRVDVFVVEQNCIYPEFDQFDASPTTLHVTGDRANGEDLETLACARVMFPLETSFDQARSSAQSAGGSEAPQAFAHIGRVAVIPELRSTGVAREMMKFTLSVIKKKAVACDSLSESTSAGDLNDSIHVDHPCRVMLSSQTYIVSFYESLGFAICSDPFMEDGIEHVDMQLDMQLRG